MDALAADFRSDTLTTPSEAMKQAMANAPLGDDVFGEDPSVNRFQDQMARLTGKEAALFFPSGSMANLAALMTQVKPGDVLYAGAMSHIHHYEMGSYARIAGLALKEVDDASGFLNQTDLEAKWNPEIYYMPKPGMVAVENTHNMLGGIIYPEAKLKKIHELTRARGIPLHMDGARVFHAAAGARKQVRDWTQWVDSVMISISKGLGCPVGSVLCASGDVIKKARRIRKLLGGGMRQVGVLAAAGSFALEHHQSALVRDITRCRKIYESLKNHPAINWVAPQTNILFAKVAHGLAPSLATFLSEKGIKALAIDPSRVRFVFHLNNTDQGCELLHDRLQAWQP